MLLQSFERFYTRVSIVAQNGGFSVFLDKLKLCTPNKILLLVPTRSLAEAIAAEWQGQGRRVLPATMPLTQLANTAIDRLSTSALRQEGVDTLLALAATDLVCYRATAPTALVEYQHAHWQPLLDGMVRRYGAQFRVTVGVMPIQQSERVLSPLRAILSDMDSLHLTALCRAATLCSSLVIALSLVDGTIGPEVAFSATQLDLLFQGAQWGIDIATAEHHRMMYKELQTLTYFTALLASG